MKMIVRVLLMLIVCASFAGCASVGATRDSTPEFHPGHPGHEVH